MLNFLISFLFCLQVTDGVWRWCGVLIVYILDYTVQAVAARSGERLYDTSWYNLRHAQYKKEFPSAFLFFVFPLAMFMQIKLCIEPINSEAMWTVLILFTRGVMMHAITYRKKQERYGRYLFFKEMWNDLSSLVFISTYRHCSGKRFDWLQYASTDTSPLYVRHALVHPLTDT